MARQKPDILIETRDEYRNTAASLMQQARHTIDIFTQNLEPEILDHSDIEQSMLTLAKRHPNTRARILVQDSTTAVHNGHCIIRLAQTLTSSIFIHKPTDKYKDDPRSFIVIDKTAFIHRVSAHDRNYNATANTHAPHEAKTLMDFFDEVWEHSSPDGQTRRVYV
jgi:hypothetical protein